MSMKNDQLVQIPERESRDPDALLKDPNLPDKQKIRLLINWRLDLLELERATEENMAGANDSGQVAEKLAEVNTALDALGVKPPSGPAT